MGREVEFAEDILAIADGNGQVEPFSSSRELSLEGAYAIAAEVMKLRLARGERQVGWKIGFTNRTTWDEYDVHAPIWGPMYDTTVGALEDADPSIDISSFAEPRIEPEIAFRFRNAPLPGMDEAALLECVDGIAHGFEIVNSMFPGWRFSAPDTVAAFALHGAYRHGAFRRIGPPDRADWLARLSAFELELLCDGKEMDRGQARNVLDGPLSALRHFVDGLDGNRHGWSVRAGHIVTTGTLTRAFPVASREVWETSLHGLALPGIRMKMD